MPVSFWILLTTIHHFIRSGNQLGLALSTKKSGPMLTKPGNQDIWHMFVTLPVVGGGF